MLRKTPVLLTLLFYFFCLLSNGVHAQTKNFVDDSLAKKFKLYAAKNTASILFAHFDKTIYVNNETVWFTAYLLNFIYKDNDPTVLSALLVNNLNKTIVLQKKFVMAEGLSFGRMTIPEDLDAGDYTFILYTNELRNGIPRDIFTQGIQVKHSAALALSASLTLLDTFQMNNRHFGKVLLKVTNSDSKPVPNAEVIYHSESSDPDFSGKVKTGKDGEYSFNVPLPQQEKKSELFITEIKAAYGNRTVSIPLVSNDKKIIVQFYPEGGRLVHTTQSIVGWEVKDAYGMAIKAWGVLLCNGFPVDTIQTDDYGMGRFKIIPMMGSKYQLYLFGEKKRIYALPEMLAKGPVVTITNALAEDTLRVRIVCKYAQYLTLVVHNFKELFLSAQVEVGSAGKNLQLLLKDVPRGLNTITLLDSAHHPIVERVFFAHYDQQNRLQITTSKPSYTTREKVVTKLKLTDGSGVPITGAVSIACVQANRFEFKNLNDIVDYRYLTSELSHLPFKENYIGYSVPDKQYLENVLLIKGWRRYSWTELEGTGARDTLITRSQIKYKGIVESSGKPVKKSVNLLLRVDSITRFASTDERGNLTLNERDLLTPDDKKIKLVFDRGYQGYSILWSKSIDSINSYLISEYVMPSNSFTWHASITNQPVLTGFEHTINLKEVAITAKKDENFSSSAINANDCGDYVCRYNFLDCPIHPYERDNRPAKIGEKYLIYSDTRPYGLIEVKSQQYYNGEKFDVVAYQGGCGHTYQESSDLILSGINYAKEFYGEDYTKVNPSQPDYVSTIFWKHLCVLNSDGEAEFSFYTSDITGLFKIVVQGVTKNDVVSGKKEFLVNEKDKSSF